VAQLVVRVEMPEFNVEAFVAKLEGLGVKLTAVPLADGKVRINRWRMLHAVDAKQIDQLWASQIGENQARIDLLAAHLAPASAKVATNAAAPVRAPARSGEGEVKEVKSDVKSKDRLGARPSTVPSTSPAPVRPPAIARRTV
jgi:hypothetical protein